MAAKRNRSRPAQRRRGKARHARGPTPSRKVAAQRAARARARSRNRLVAAGVVVVVVMAVLASFATSRTGTDGNDALGAGQPTPTPFPAAGCAGDEVFDDGREHVASPSYSVDPPAGGDHLARPAATGVYDDARPDGELVHSMEHGFVVLWHQPDPTPAVQTAIDSLAQQFPRELVVVPRPGLGGPVAVTAWHRRLLCASPDVDRLAEFVRTRRDKGPESGFL